MIIYSLIPMYIICKSLLRVICLLLLLIYCLLCHVANDQADVNNVPGRCQQCTSLLRSGIGTESNSIRPFQESAGDTAGATLVVATLRCCQVWGGRCVQFLLVCGGGICPTLPSCCLSPGVAGQCTTCCTRIVGGVPL